MAAWWLNREKSAVALSVAEESSYLHAGTGGVKVDLKFKITNVGREATRWLTIEPGSISKTRRAYEGGSPIQQLNPIQPGAAVQFGCSLVMPDPASPQRVFSVGEGIALAAQSVLTLRLAYRGRSKFSWAEREECYYFAFTETGALRHLLRDEYDELRPLLPTRNRVDLET